MTIRLHFSIALLAVQSIFGAQAPAAAPASRKAPELPFTLPQQGQKTLSQYKGKVVALEFILTTCMHCQAASHIMTKLQAELGTKDLQVLDLALNGLDESRNAKQADALVTEFKTNYNVGFPVGWVRRELMSPFMGFSIMDRTVVPQLVLIDRQGNIRYQTPPMGDENATREATIRERLQELLAPAAANVSSNLRRPAKAQR